MDFLKWLEGELAVTEFDEGDTLDTYYQLGEEVLAEELREDMASNFDEIERKLDEFE